MIKFKDINNNAHLAVASISRKHSVNGEKSLSGTIYSGDDVLNNLDTGWGLEFDSEPYVITYFEHHDSNNTISFDAIHKFFWDFSKKMFYRKFNGSNTIDTYLGNIFDGTGYKYALNFKPNAISKDSFGMTSKMSMFNDIITAIGAEFEVNGTLVSIYQKIGTDLSTIVRHGFNLSDMAIQNDISGFATYAEGFGVHTNPDDENSPRLHVVYESPLAKTYGRIEAEPIDDERYTVQDNLLDALKAKVDNTLPVSISLSLYDLNKSGYPYKMAKVGDWITAVDEKINFKQKIRIISVDDEFSSDGKRISYAVTAGNISSVQRYQEANASISSRINNAINSADQANQAALSAQVTADGKNTIYRVNSVDKLPTNANEGDLGWVQSGDGLVLYIYTKRPDGSFFWDKRIDPEMGQQITDGVNNAVNQAKTYTDGVKSKVESDIKQASQNANDALTTAKTDLNNSIDIAKSLAGNAQASANQANTDLITAKTDLSNDINTAKDLAQSAQDTANQANTDLVQTKKDLANTAGDLESTKTDLNAKLNDKASVSYVDTANGQLNAQLVTQGKSIAAINFNSDKLSASLVNTQGDVSKLSQTANTLSAGLNDANGNIATLQGKADEFDFTVAKVNNLSYENRNLILKSGDLTVTESNAKKASQLSAESIGISFPNSITLSFDARVSNVTSFDNSSMHRIRLELYIIDNNNNEHWYGAEVNNANNIFNNQKQQLNIGTYINQRLTLTVPTDATFTSDGIANAIVSLSATGFNADIIELKNPKIEIGLVSTPYSQAPEDTITDLASLHVQANQIDQTVSNQDGRITTAQQTADKAVTQVQGLDGRMTTVETTANGTSTLVNDPQKGLNALSVKADENSAIIQSTKGDVSTLQQRADEFDFTVAKVNNLSYENRNLILKSGDLTVTESNAKKASQLSAESIGISFPNSITLSFDARVSNVTSFDNSSMHRIRLELYIIDNNNNEHWYGAEVNNANNIFNDQQQQLNIGTYINQRITLTVPTDATFTSDGIANAIVSLSATGFNADIIELKNPKIEIGLVSTPYSQAPEDTITDLASLHVQANRIDQTVSNQDGRITTAQQTADKAVTQVQGLDGRVATVETTANGTSTLVNDPQKGLNALSVKVDENSAIIQSTKGDVSTLQQRADSVDISIASAFEGNMITQPFFDTSNGFDKWESDGTLYLTDTLAKPPIQAGLVKKWLGISHSRNTFSRDWYPAIPGRVLTIDLWCANYSGFNVKFGIQVVNNTTNAIDYVISDTLIWNNTAWGDFSGIVKIPAGFDSYRLMLICDTDDISKAESYFLTNVKMSALASGEQLASIQVKTDSITNFVKDGNGNLASDFMSALLRTSLMKGVDGGSSLMSQTANSFNQAIQDNNKKVISFINLDNSGAQIKGKLLTLDGDTNVTGDFYAKGGNFKNLNASNMNTGTLDANKVHVANIDAGSITSGRLNTELLTISSDSTDSLQMKLRNNGLHIEGHVPGAYYDNRLDIDGLSLTFPGAGQGTWGQDTFQRAGGVQAISLDQTPNMFNTSVVLYGDKTGGGHSAALGIKNKDGAIHRSFIVTDGAGLPDYANQGAGLYAFDHMVLTEGLSIVGPRGLDIETTLRVGALLHGTNNAQIDGSLEVIGGFKTGVFGESDATLRFQSVKWGDKSWPGIVNAKGTGVVFADSNIAVVRQWVVDQPITD